MNSMDRAQVGDVVETPLQIKSADYLLEAELIRNSSDAAHVIIHYKISREGREPPEIGVTGAYPIRSIISESARSLVNGISDDGMLSDLESLYMSIDREALVRILSRQMEISSGRLGYPI